VPVRSLVAAGLAVALSLAGCGTGGERASTRPTSSNDPDRTSARSATETTTAPPSPPSTTTLTRPDWLGTRVLPTGPDGSVVVPPTPPELDPRRLPTIDVLPPPADGGFHATVTSVPTDVTARSTWSAACPVSLDELRYVTVTFWGFDGGAHTGELLVHRDAAEPVTGVFQRLFEARFPIEDMHVTSAAELDAPNTGDGNSTAGFVCRASRGSTSWSQHAYGLAIDVNPIENPYVHGGRVEPPAGRRFLDRSRARRGMVVSGGVVDRAFAAIGWRWGGRWSTPDYQHFSSTGR
jgi:D-alanyl-D-alanine carboxypeptidase